MNTFKVLIEVELRGEGGLTEARAIAAVKRSLLVVPLESLSHEASLIDTIEEELAEDFVDVVEVKVRT